MFERPNDRMTKRRSNISLKADPALVARRVIIGADKLVYVLVADRAINYSKGRSRIVYVGTTKKGGSRIAQSVATRSAQILRLHGVIEFEARVLTRKPRQRLRMWVRLERAILLVFRECFGEIPKCNKHGKQIIEGKEFELFSRARIQRVVKELS